MIHPRYSEADETWLITDKNGAVGVFLSRGEAPIPIEIIEATAGKDLQIWAILDGLPIMGGANLVVGMSDAQDYLELAKRGLYVYEWQDPYRFRGSDDYIQIATPERSITWESLSRELREVLHEISLPKVDFRRYPSLNISYYVPCGCG